MLHLALRTARKVVILVVGGTVVLFGIALIFLPGPAFVVIPIGLAILAIEFAWARHLLKRMKQKLDDARSALGAGSSAPPPAA